MEESGLDRLAGIIELDGGEKWMETAFERRASGIDLLGDARTHAHTG